MKTLLVALAIFSTSSAFADSMTCKVSTTRLSEGKAFPFPVPFQFVLKDTGNTMPIPANSSREPVESNKRIWIAETANEVTQESITETIEASENSEPASPAEEIADIAEQEQVAAAQPAQPVQPAQPNPAPAPKVQAIDTRKPMQTGTFTKTFQGMDDQLTVGITVSKYEGGRYEVSFDIRPKDQMRQLFTTEYFKSHFAMVHQTPNWLFRVSCFE